MRWARLGTGALRSQTGYTQEQIALLLQGKQHCDRPSIAFNAQSLHGLYATAPQQKRCCFSMLSV